MSYLFQPCPDGWDGEVAVAAPFTQDSVGDGAADSDGGLGYYALELAPGHRETLADWPIGTVESITVITGTVSVFDGCETWSLGRGDRLLCHPGMDHEYRNTGTVPAVLCLIMRD